MGRIKSTVQTTADQKEMPKSLIKYADEDLRLNFERTCSEVRSLLYI